MKNIRQQYLSGDDFVHRIIRGKPGKKIWHITHYCKTNQRYQLMDTEDVSNCIYLDGHTLVASATY